MCPKNIYQLPRVLTRGGKTSLKAGFSPRLFKFRLKPIKFLTIYPRPKRDMAARTCSLFLMRIDQDVKKSYHHIENHFSIKFLISN